MSQAIRTCSKVASLVGELCRAVPGDPLAAVEVVDPASVPQPYRRLLVHDSDMTSTLEDYYGEPIMLKVLNRVATPRWLARRSVLELAESGTPVEYGLIRIDLAVLDEPIRRQVLDGELPLGGLLNTHGVVYRSCPGGFLRVEASGAMLREFNLDRPAWLYGRCNCLSDPLGKPIAEVIEILPPEGNGE
ncbi:MAG: hypothetical protein KJZ87_01630 [Thermoguttaceae bacterium]|nr:hypothetical protein [Thermoguttaceae bacterium]